MMFESIHDGFHKSIKHINVLQPFVCQKIWLNAISASKSVHARAETEKRGRETLIKHTNTLELLYESKQKQPLRKNTTDTTQKNNTSQ